MSISPTILGTTPQVVAHREGGAPLLVRLRTEDVAAAAPDVDLDRAESIELVTGTAVDPTCTEGQLERPPNLAPALKLSAPGLATLHELGASGPSAPLAEWPTALRELSLRVPLREPCAPLPARVAPFTDRKRLYELGDVLAGRTLTPETVGLTDARGLAYLEDDRVLLALPEVLLILERGRAPADALHRVVTGPDFLGTPGEGQSWSLQNMALEPSGSPRRRAHAILRLNQRLSDDASFYAGLGVADFVVTSTSISSARLRYFQPIAHERRDPPKLDRLAANASGGFFAVGDKLIVWGEAEGPVHVETPQGLNGGSALYAPPPLPSVIVQDKRGGWWTGQLGAELQLTRESRNAGLMISTETDGTLRIMRRGDDARVVSGNQLAELWEREGAQDWRRHRWWLPPAAAACGSSRPRCGRLEPRAVAPMSDFEVEGEAVLHTFRDCGFFFRTRPGENRCSEYLEFDFDEHRLPNDTPNVNYATRRGGRFLFAGDGGLLVELSLD